MFVKRSNPLPKLEVIQGGRKRCVTLADIAVWRITNSMWLRLKQSQFTVIERDGSISRTGVSLS